MGPGSRLEQSGDTGMKQHKKAVRPPFSFFVERKVRPGLAGYRKILGSAGQPWDDLATMLTEAFGLKAKIHFMYGEKYGWALRFERYGRLVAAMYPNRGRLYVQIILNRAQVNAAMAMSLPPHVSAALNVARDYPEGRWLFIPVRSRKQAGELHSIFALKMPWSAKSSGKRQ
jgi:hypothetical protein